MSDERECPEGWELEPLSDCVDILDNKRVPVSRKERDSRQGTVPYYGATGQAGWIDDFIFDEELVLLGEDGAPFLDASKPKAYMVSGKSWVNNHAHVLRATSGLSNKFLLHSLNTLDYRPFVSGSTRLKLTQGAMKRIPIAHPALDQQRRIVAKIEELFERSRKAKEHLDRIPPLVDRLRKSILAAAFRGDLTKDWREHNPDVEPATELLKRIRQERRKKWEADQLAKYEAKGKKPPKNWQSKYKEELGVASAVVMDNGSQTREVGDPYRHSVVAPASWVARNFSDVCYIIGGSQPPKSTFVHEARPGYVRLIQIRDYKSDKHITFIPRDKAKRFCSVDDIMIGRYGPPIFQILRGLEGAYNVALMKAEPLAAILDREFLFYWLQNPLLFAFVEAGSLRTSGQDGVNKAYLEEYPFFIPPIEEQRLIASRVGQAFHRIEELVRGFSDASPRCERLERAILAKAFRGELLGNSGIPSPQG